MTIVARLKALEQQALAWGADDAVDGEAVIVKLAGLLGDGLPPDQAADAYARLDWALDQQGAPTSLPGVYGPVSVSRADRIAALLGMTSKEFKAELESRAG